ncbi:recombinase family protein [Pontiellaceae bacterium B12227]|nr:recombinase family protein [Pontiellaceae bacterium B12227]
MKMESNDPVPVIIYVRKSTDAGPDTEVNSLAVQQAAAESYIASQQHLGWTCTGVYSDNNKSGATLERQGLQEVIRLVKAGEIKVVVIHRLDRISRSLIQFFELLALFEEHGVALVSVMQNINTEGAVGRLMLTVFMSFAEFERELIRDRVTERMHAARKMGRFIGGRPVLGYRIKAGGGELEPDELEALRVREIFVLYLELRSVKAVLRELNRRGWRNKKWVTKEGKVSGGSEFSTSGLHHLLTNPIYIGKVTLKGETFEGCHDGIVDPAVFSRVQKMLAENSVQKGSRKRNSHDALLKGLLKCASCNTAFVHNYTKKKNRMYRYYTCSNKRLNGAHACPSPSIPAGEIENLVAEQLLSIGTDPELQELVYQQLAETMEEKRTALEQQRKTAKRQLGRIEKELASSREFGAPEPLIRHLEEKRKEAEDLLENAKNIVRWRKPSRKGIAAVLRDMQGLWPSFNTGEKCAFVKALVNQIDYDAVEGNITLHFNDEGFVQGEVV